MAFARVVRNREIGNRLVVEVAPAQIVDVVAHGRQLEAEEMLASAEIAQVQQKVDFGADRAALLQFLALRSRQRKEQIPVALGEARKAPQQLVLLRREDLQAIAALWEAVTVKTVER